MTAAPEEDQHERGSMELAAGFAPVDRHRWQELAAVALRRGGRLGEDADVADVERVLTTTTYDGVGVLPLYTAEDTAPDPGLPGTAPFVRGRTPQGAAAGGWHVRQRHADPDVDACRDAVMTDLENGATSLWLTVGPAGIPVDGLEGVLRDVFVDLAPVVLDAGPDTEAAAQEFLRIAEEKAVAPEALPGNLGADPLGYQARTGRDAPAEIVVALARRCAEEYPLLRSVVVDGTPYHDAGGSDAEELAASLAAGVAYLRALTDGGLTAEQAFGQLEFRYAASADQFATIAKFRAARRLWARVGEACGVTGEAAGQLQHAVTSSAMTTRRDPWVNMLRCTLAAFGAGVGGADAVTVQPFDAAIGLSDGLSRRIARNTSSLLILESNVARVVDPAGGSWYVEQLTDGLARAAWAWFQEIEGNGGLAASLRDGLVAGRLAATWDRRAKNLATRRDKLTGVNEFPDVHETPVVRRPFERAFPGAAPGEDPEDAPRGLPVHRYASEYEALRDAADEAGRPAVFLATLGTAAQSTTRGGFAANLFQAGGFATPNSGTGTDPEAIAAAFRDSGARIACLASSDAVYAEHAAPVAAALRQAGAERIWLAGKPGDREESDAAAGVTGYLAAGGDALAVLREAHAAAGLEGDR